MKQIVLIINCLFLFSCSTATCKKNQLQAKTTEVSSEKMTLDKNMINTKKIKVAKPDGTLQCNQGVKVSLVEMQKQLQDIPVFSSENIHDGMMRIQMCGTPTGNHNVYEINESDLDKAISYGFKRWK